MGLENVLDRISCKSTNKPSVDKRVETWIALLVAADKVSRPFIHTDKNWIVKFKAEVAQSLEELRKAVEAASGMLASYDSGPDYTNLWHVNCSERERCILEDYVFDLEVLSHKFHLRLLDEGMDAMESALRLKGVNKSDP